MKKIHAFTLLELIIVLVLISVLIFLGLSTQSRLLNRNARQLNNSSKNISEFLILKQIRNDVNTCKILRGYNNRIICEFEGLIRQYQISDSLLVIKNNEGNNDTISVVFENLHFEYIERDIVNEISFDYIRNDEVFHCVIYKDYPPSILFKLRRE